MDEKDLNVAKELSLGYFITGLVILAVAVLLGFLTRLSQTGFLGEVPAMYYSFMTLHGMAAFVGWACFVAIGLTWYVLVRTLDSPLHSPTFVKVIYWTFVSGFTLLVISVFFGNFGGSWVFLYPIAFYGYWSTWSAFTWILGVILAGLGIIFYTVEIYLTIRKSKYTYAQALGFESWSSNFEEMEDRIPVAVVPLGVISLGMFVGTVPFAVHLILYMFETVDITLIPQDPLIAKNILWWFGHPVVYLILFPVVSFLYMLVSEYAGRPLVGEKYTKLAWTVAVIVQNIIGAHHIYMDFEQAIWYQVLVNLATYIIILPSLISLFSITATIYVSKFKWDVVSKYIMTALTFWFLAGVSGWINATMTLNKYIHNTLWVVGHFHLMVFLGLSTALFGMGYYLIEDYTGRPVKTDRNAESALWYMIVGGVVFTHLWMIQGLWGGIRRYYNSSPDSLNLLTWIGLPFALLMVWGVLVNTWVVLKNTIFTGDEAVSSSAVPA